MKFSCNKCRFITDSIGVVVATALRPGLRQDAQKEVANLFFGQFDSVRRLLIPV
jgi:hypothetical protein